MQVYNLIAQNSLQSHLFLENYKYIIYIYKVYKIVYTCIVDINNSKIVFMPLIFIT